MSATIMIIDAHTHLGNPNGAIDARAVDLIRSMDIAGIDKAMVFAGRLNSITTEQVINEIAPYKDRLYAIGSISLDSYIASDIYHQMEQLLDTEAIHGIKFYTGYEYFYPYDERLRSILSLLVDYSRPAIFHSGDTFSKAGNAKLKYAMPIHIDDLAVDMPDLKIIIAHMGYPWQRDTGEVVYKNKNVYADCSGAVYGSFDYNTREGFKRTLDEFVDVAGGMDKLLFGSDWPISNQKSYVETVTNLALSAVDINQIMSETAKKVFGL